MTKTNKSKFRLLPIIIFLCVIIFSLKIESMWESKTGNEEKNISFISLPSAQAQKVNPVSEEAPKEQTGSAVDDEAISNNPSNLAVGEITDPDEDSFSQEEMKILQNLASRRDDIEKKEKELEIKIAMLNAAEMQIDKKVKKLKDLEASIQKLVNAYDNQEKTQLDSLVTIYSNMKPKDAARIFNDLDMEILIKLFSQMKESKAATILSAMDSAKANALTLELANKNRPDFIKKQ